MMEIKKKMLCAVLVTPLLFSCSHQGDNTTQEKEKFVTSLLQQMTLEEKIGQLSQCAGEFSTGPDNKKIDRTEDISKGLIGSMLNVSGVKRTRRMQDAAMQSRLKIPLVFGLDVIHGYKTGFPIPLAEAASFDLDAIQRSSRCAAIEASASGLHWTFAPMVDVSWDARWGRVLEGAGEDAFYGAQVAKARVTGLQNGDLSADNTIMACVKHFTSYGAPMAGKDYNSVDMSWGHFANFYMPPYKAAMEAGAATFMSAFNDFNNEPCTGNEGLLRNLLKEKWGFEGFVVSDWASVEEMIPHRYAENGKEAALKAIRAGLDMEMVSECYRNNLTELVQNGDVDVKLVDDAVKRILLKKYELGLFEDPYKYCDEQKESEIINSKAMRDEARYVAERSIVLLKNEKEILPLSSEIKKVALIGPLSKSQKDMCGAWSCADRSKVVTLYEALKERDVEINYSEGYDLSTNQIKDLNQTLSQVRKSDVAIIAMGEQAWESGEMRSKADINIPQQQQLLVEEILKTGKPVVVLMMCGRPVIFNSVREKAPAILCTWWLSSEAGPAICNVLWGDYNPSGKLPMTFPQHIGQIPIYYQYKSTGRPEAPDGWATRYIDLPYAPAYPFGFGLSYTDFSYSDLNLKSVNNDSVYAQVAITVQNTGKYDGEEVVQLYVHDKAASITRPIKELRGFEKIFLKSGEKKEVTFDITEQQLGFYNNKLDYVVEKGDFVIMIGSDSQNLQSIDFTL